jgi:hypothetical protein
MTKFDYNSPADLFPSRRRVGRRPVGYRRFETAAQAIRYAVEEMPKDFLGGAVLESDSERIKGEDIHLLYSSDDYPLARK